MGHPTLDTSVTPDGQLALAGYVGLDGRVASDSSRRVRRLIENWPVYRQLTGPDRLGRGAAARSPDTEESTPRTLTAARVTSSICPYCAVGCGQRVYVASIDGKDSIAQIEGDPDSPVSRGRLCPKGAASKQLVTHAGRLTKVLYRRPYGTAWEPLDLDEAMHMIADRVVATRNATWQETVDGKRVRRTLGFASLGGATLDNEENYLIKKLWTALGAIQIENQARI
jgi:formate dehydrogenase major subunit